MTSCSCSASPGWPRRQGAGPAPGGSCSGRRACCSSPTRSRSCSGCYATPDRPSRTPAPAGVLHRLRAPPLCTRRWPALSTSGRQDGTRRVQPRRASWSSASRPSSHPPCSSSRSSLGVEHDSWAIVVGSIVLFALVFARMVVAIEQVEEVNRSRAELQEQLAYDAAHDALTQLPEPGPRAGPDPPGAGPRPGQPAPARRCCSSTSTASSTSTTPWATAAATRCCAGSRTGCASRCAATTSPSGTAVTSSSCCCERRRGRRRAVGRRAG